MCPDDALDMFGLDLQVFQDKCTYCTLCVRFCPVGALSIEKRAPQGGENAVVSPKTPADFHWPTPAATTSPAVWASLASTGSATSVDTVVNGGSPLQGGAA
jgi:Fe-S-cluster-containing hydrogenase component 2